MAHVRFDSCENQGILNISIAVAPEHGGKGLGSKLLELALGRSEIADRASLISADTFVDNQASIRLFAKQRFVQVGTLTRDGKEFITWRKPLGKDIQRYPLILLGDTLRVSKLGGTLKKFSAKNFLIVPPSITTRQALTAHFPGLLEWLRVSQVGALFLVDSSLSGFCEEWKTLFPDGVYDLGEAGLSVGDCSQISTRAIDQIASLAFQKRSRLEGLNFPREFFPAT